MAYNTVTNAFWGFYGRFFSTKLNGEVCDKDILRCFEYEKESKKYARAKEDIQVYKSTIDHDDDNKKGYSVTTLTIPKGTRVHLGNNYQKEAPTQEVDRYLHAVKCRAEEARVDKADIRGERKITYSRYTTWNGQKLARTAYKSGEPVKPSSFYDKEKGVECDEWDCAEIYDMTCQGGIHFFLRKEFADQYGKL